VKHLVDLVALLLFASGIGLILWAIIGLQGCASPSQAVTHTRCMTDPGNNSMHCDGQSFPWGDKFRGYVCHRIEDDEAICGSGR